MFGKNVSWVGKKSTSCGEKVGNWRKNKMHDLQLAAGLLAQDYQSQLAAG